MKTDPGRPEATNLAKVQRRMLGIFPKALVAAVCKSLNVIR